MENIKYCVISAEEMEKYRISKEDLKTYFNNRREVTIAEYNAYLKIKEERKARNEQI